MNYDMGFDLRFSMFRGINAIKVFKNLFMLKRVDINSAPNSKLGSSEFCI